MAINQSMKAVLLLIMFFSSGLVSAMQTSERKNLQNLVKEMFYHGYNNYMNHAWPKDELKPISCQGVETWGGYSLTLIDALDTLVIMGDYEEFVKRVHWVANHVSFDHDMNVSVFESNIRVLGGLLSAHLLLDKEIGSIPEISRLYQEKFGPYKGELLQLAIDLGDRLLVAFDTPTGMPYGTINFLRGVPRGETPVTCTASTSTFSIEFGILSRLTGDWRYEDAAKRAVRGLWKARSSANLVGNHIDVITGHWVYSEAGIAGGVDSFYEYLLKSAILFDDEEYWQIFNVAYKAANAKLIRAFPAGNFYIQTDIEGNYVRFATVGSLQAFWSGLQVLYGDVMSAATNMISIQNIWKKHAFFPEHFNVATNSVEESRPGYPLRPEMAEALYYLSRATHTDLWLDFGKDIVYSINNLTRTPCGFACIQDVQKLSHRDLMESFFLSETLKYLYLLFQDEESEETPDILGDGNYIFNTEAHPFPIVPLFHTKSPNTGKSTVPQSTTPLNKAKTPGVPWILKHSTGIMPYRWSGTEPLNSNTIETPSIGPLPPIYSQQSMDDWI